MHRRGFTLLEMAVATVLVAALLTLSVEALGWSAAQRRETDRRSLALIEGGNALERVAAMRWAEITPESIDSLKLSSLAQEKLPDGTLRATLHESPGEPASKRITVEVSWSNRSGQRETPIRLSTWIYRARAEVEP